MQEAEFVIRGTLITMDPHRRVISDGAVAIVGDRIAGVGTSSEIEAQFRTARTLGGTDHYVIPGLIDCHNHFAQALVREAALEDLPNIARVYIPAEAVMDDDDIRVSAPVAIGQLLRAGVTTVAETTGTTAHEQVIAQTVMTTGIRCAMARGSGDRTSHLESGWEQISGRSWLKDDPGLLREDVAATEEFLERWTTAGKGRLRPWIHGVSLPNSSDERMLVLTELASRYGTGVMHHINRDREEVEFSLAMTGERPIEHLYRIGAIQSNFLAIHAMLTTYREIQLLAQVDAKLAHAPVVCTDIVSAVTKIAAMRAAGVTVGLGCDTVINDVLGVMRIAFFMHQQDNAIRWARSTRRRRCCGRTRSAHSKSAKQPT